MYLEISPTKRDSKQDSSSYYINKPFESKNQLKSVDLTLKKSCSNENNAKQLLLKSESQQKKLLEEKVNWIDSETRTYQARAHECEHVNTKNFQLIHSLHDFHEIDSKISQLNVYFKLKMFYVKRHDRNESLTRFLNQATKIAEAVLLVKRLDVMNKKELYNIQQQLLSLCEHYEDHQGVKIQFRRMHSLIIQKLFVLFERHKNSKPQSIKKQIIEQQDGKYSIYQDKQIQQDNNSDSQTRNPEGITQTSAQDLLRSMISDKKLLASTYQQQINNSQIKISNSVDIKNQIHQSSTKITKRTPQTFQMNVGNYLRSNRNGFLSNIEIGTSRQVAQRRELSVDEHLSLESDKISTDQPQRLFYSMCLNQKLKMPQNHPSQKIPVSQLYQEMQRKFVDHTQWKDFIQSALKCPLKFLNNETILNNQSPKDEKNTLNKWAHHSLFNNQNRQF